MIVSIELIDDNDDDEYVSYTINFLNLLLHQYLN